MLSSEARHTLSVNKHDTHMRTSRTLSVSMPPAQLRQVERLAKKENRTLSELVREALRRYQQKPASPAGAELIAALRAVQETLGGRAWASCPSGPSKQRLPPIAGNNDRQESNNPSDEPPTYRDRYQGLVTK